MKKIIGIAIILGHLTLCLGYLTPVKYTNEVWKYWSVTYCFPMWHMSAQLFAPMAVNYVRWYKETEDCEWQPIYYVDKQDTYIHKRLENRVGEFISFSFTKELRNKQLRLTCPEAETFLMVSHRYTGQVDSTIFSLPKTEADVK